MKNDPINSLIFLRFAVGFLGKHQKKGWWDCDFLSKSGLESLDYNFSRATLSAAFTATCMAAKRLHDDRIGRSGVIHLFRLDPDLEILVQRGAASDGGTLLKSLPFDANSLMCELATLAEHEIDSPEGPVQVGSLEQAATKKGIAELARHYHAAFRLGHRIFPYFAAKRA